MAENVKCVKCKNFRHSMCMSSMSFPDPEIVRDCWHYAPFTYGDRIRSMSDERLADLLIRISGCSNCPRNEDPNCHEECKDTILKQLRSEAD